MEKPLIIYSSVSCGSAIAEAFLTIAGLSFERKAVDYNHESPTYLELKSVNPLGQIPAVILPTGELLTETLAIMFYAQALNPKANLVPRSPKTLAKFFRWATMMVTAIYPTYTYGDDPQQWVGSDNKAAGEALRKSTDDLRKKLWLLIEDEIKGEFFLGETISAIDVYIAVMTKWRPGAAWFAEHTPKAVKIARTVGARPELAEIWKWNFSS